MYSAVRLLKIENDIYCTLVYAFTSPKSTAISNFLSKLQEKFFSPRQTCAGYNQNILKSNDYFWNYETYIQFTDYEKDEHNCHGFEFNDSDGLGPHGVRL